MEETVKFTWIPIYKEIAQKLRQFQDKQQELIDILKRIGIDRFNDYFEDGSVRELSEIDPFTFFAYLNKYSNQHRVEYLKKLCEEWQLTSPAPSDVAGLPTSHPMKVWMFPYARDRHADDIPVLWDLFKQALDHTIQNETLQRVLDIHSVGNRKLSISWFYTDPNYYLPLDSLTSNYLRKHNISPVFSTIEEYEAIKMQAEEQLKKEPYKISYDAWKTQLQLTEKKGQNGGIATESILSGCNNLSVSNSGYDSVKSITDKENEEKQDITTGGTITSVSDLMSRIFDESIMGDNNGTLYYRGQPDVDFELIPGIYRKPDRLIRHEHIMFKEMENAVPAEFVSCKCTFDKLVKMQHYGLPTRLLDITKNPLVALYFACSDKTTEGKDGGLFLFVIHADDSSIKYSDGDAVSIVSNIARRPEDFDITALRKMDITEFNGKDPIPYLLHDIRCCEKPHFLSVVNPDDIESVFFVKPKIDNPRIAKQEGAFFLFGIDGSKLKCPNLPAFFESTKFLIPADSKPKILTQLAALGITEASLFPDIDHIAHNIKKSYGE